MERLVFKTPEEIEEYYNTENNTYYFTSDKTMRGEKLNVIFEFLFNADRNIVAAYIRATDIIGIIDINCRDLWADNILAHNVEVYDTIRVKNTLRVNEKLTAKYIDADIIKAQNIRAHDVIAKDSIDAYSIRATSFIKAKDLKAYSIESDNIEARIIGLKDAFKTTLKNGRIKILCSDK